MNLVDFYNQFPTEQACLEYLEAKRWPNVRTCPHCLSDKTYKFTSGRLFKCGTCRKQFTAKVGTIFSDSKIPLQKWFLVIYLATSLKKGISSVQVSKYVGVTQKSAWFMLQRIRYALEKLGGNPLDGVFEIDETYTGGNQKGLRGRAVSGSNKAMVFGAVERSGRVRALHLPNSRGEVLLPAVSANVAGTATVMSDQYTVYSTLARMGYARYAISHTLRFAIGPVHTNTIEGFWSQLKRGINGIYHHVDRRHLQKYCSEYEYRYNTREMTDGERFADWFNKINDRLTYKELCS